MTTRRPFIPTHEHPFPASKTGRKIEIRGGKASIELRETELMPGRTHISRQGTTLNQSIRRPDTSFGSEALDAPVTFS